MPSSELGPTSFSRMNSPAASQNASDCFCESSRRKAEPKLIITTPPFSATLRIISSSMLRSQPGVKLRHEECEAMTGAVVSSMTCQKASSEMCETSTITPWRFISATTSRPNGLSPFQVRSSGST